jgi:hypothetical protein
MVSLRHGISVYVGRRFPTAVAMVLRRWSGSGRWQNTKCRLSEEGQEQVEIHAWCPGGQGGPGRPHPRMVTTPSCWSTHWSFCPLLPSGARDEIAGAAMQGEGKVGRGAWPGRVWPELWRGNRFRFMPCLSRQLFPKNQKPSRRLDPKADLISPDLFTTITVKLSPMRIFSSSFRVKINMAIALPGCGLRPPNNP